MICREDRLWLMPSPNLGFAPHIVPLPSQTWHLRPGRNQFTLIQAPLLARDFEGDSVGCRRTNGWECNHWGGLGRSAATTPCPRWACCGCHEGHRVIFWTMYYRTIDSREFSRFFFWNFTSQSRSQVIFISLLNLDFQSFLFHFHFSKRMKEKKFTPFLEKIRVIFDTKIHEKFNHSRRVKNPKQLTSGIKICSFLILEKFHFSISKL